MFYNGTSRSTCESSGADSEGSMRSSRQDISSETRALVLQRDGFTCQMCGAVSGEPHHDDNGHTTRIQVGRILAKSLGGGNERANLRAICSVCNEGLRNLTLERPSLRDLLIQIRRATGGHQLEVLKWLVAKYPTQASEFGAEEGRAPIRSQPFNPRWPRAAPLVIHPRPRAPALRRSASRKTRRTPCPLPY